MNRAVLVLLTVFASVMQADYGERTVGLLLSEEGSYPGYTLFSPMSYTTTYLIDHEGNLVHSWESEYRPGLMAYLSPDGYLYRSIVTDYTPIVPLGGGVEKLDWDGNVLWHYELKNSHHDIEILPSGNVLMIACEIKDSVQTVEAGADPEKVHNKVYSEYIIEVEPQGATEGNIVWEWHFWDHLVQDYDSIRNNYGDVDESPELMDINSQERVQEDWIHLNSVDYNEGLDQIMLTTPYWNEIWVLDHSTTTSEARGHTGGKYMKGGDLLYRWGNPEIYGWGGQGDQQLYGAHDGSWIEDGSPGAGNILVFNNGNIEENRAFSTVDEIDPPVSADGFYATQLPYAPLQPIWSWTAPDPGDFFASNLSGAQRLPNGNTLICDGVNGDFFQVTPEGEIVWRYVSPVTYDGPVEQGIKPSGFNCVFKTRTYSADYPGLAGRDLTPKGTIEKYTTIAEPVSPSGTIVEFSISPNPLVESTTILFQLDKPRSVSIKIFNTLGQEVKTLVDRAESSGGHHITWDKTDNTGKHLSQGVYFCTLKSGNFTRTERLTILR
ncbi:aryl-sulfate sulfotransferase [candidate division WOR-3 bacterium]|nr:aryl-sulfate sulfotransferase [candidate division WOR-3 bacterium]